MRVLLDERLPERLKDELPGHQVRTAREAGLAGKKNGLLMELASAQFDVLVTVDRGIASQQNTTNSSLGMVLIHARSNSFAALAVLLPELRQAVALVMPGQVLRVRLQRGARVSEATGRSLEDVLLDRASALHLHGKGAKGAHRPRSGRAPPRSCGRGSFTSTGAPSSSSSIPPPFAARS